MKYGKWEDSSTLRIGAIRKLNQICLYLRGKNGLRIKLQIFSNILCIGMSLSPGTMDALINRTSGSVMGVSVQGQGLLFILCHVHRHLHPLVDVQPVLWPCVCSAYLHRQHSSGEGFLFSPNINHARVVFLFFQLHVVLCLSLGITVFCVCLLY